MDRKTLNIGLVGYKFMGRAHSSAYMRIPMFFDPGADIRLKSICGRNAQWLADVQKKFGFEGYDTNWKELVKRPDIDIIDITTPSNFHKEIAVAAAENGKHVFCEKPLALNVKDAEEMLAAAKKAGVKHQIGFNYRFAPAIQLAKKLIDDGRLGKIFHYRALYLQDWIIDPAFPLVWRLDKKVCGSGSLGDLGAHIIDLGRYLVGEYDSVVGMEKTFVKQRPLVERMEGLSGSANADAPLGNVEVDDATVAMFDFKNGAIGTIEATRFSAGHDNDMVFEINGEKGSIRYRFERMNELEFYDRENNNGETKGFINIAASQGCHNYAANWWPAGHVLGYDHTFVHELYEFIKAAANDAPTSPDFEDGVACSRVIEAIEESIKERCWINI
ncbi:MAG: Gfo/Idh/MocA family oxidoreductase [Oscillospiraceae bacterium]|nr:Gfo/Idh/MocA family oxidoreductase [Oscillospiraceae bacterium]